MQIIFYLCYLFRHKQHYVYVSTKHAGCELNELYNINIYVGDRKERVSVDKLI